MLYRKSLISLCIFNVMIILLFLCTGGIRPAKAYAGIRQNVRTVNLLDHQINDSVKGQGKEEQAVQCAASIKIQELPVNKEEGVRTDENMEALQLDETEYDNLCRIVEAEAGCEDDIGKMLVANVVLNRVGNDAFPNSISEVIFQNDNNVSQFSPVSNGRFYQVIVSDATYDAVNRVLEGEDVSQGALFFMARKYANPESVKWFDEKLDYLFQHGNHEFYK